VKQKKTHGFTPVKPARPACRPAGQVGQALLGNFSPQVVYQREPREE